MKRILNIALVAILVFCGVLGLMSAFPEPAAAATLEVTTTSDTVDDQANTSADLATDEADGDGLSLREALYWAATGDIVTFDSSLSGQTVTLSGTQLTIEKDIILDGDLDDNGIPDITIDGNNTSRVFFTSGLTGAARLEGFTATNGSATYGGVIYNTSSSPTITNCIFSNSIADYAGGMLNNSSSPTITNCTFSGNSANIDSGGMENNSSSPTITNCTFSGNSANKFGGGMENISSSPAINNCIFSGNSADTGGGMYNSNSSPTITNCGFFDNIAGDIGGGMANANSSPTITNCTFAGNWAQYCSIFGDPLSGITITNCIIWGNTGAGAGCFGGIDATAATVNYSNVHLFAGCVEVPGTYPGTGNIQQDALFVDAAGGDYHLQSQSGHWTSTGWVTDAQTSPCIDTGSPASACGNEPSPNGGRINMGAYGNTAQASKSLPTTLTVTTNSDAGDNTTFGVSLGADEADGSGLSIREALNWASAGDTVTFDGGLSGQTVTLSDQLSIIDKDITLDGDLDDDSTPDITISGNNTSRVIYTTGLTAAARLEGFTITNGYNTNLYGGGMSNSSSSPTISNCVFSNSNANFGGGMYNFQSSPTITSCTFSSNAAHTIQLTDAVGGAMYNSDSSSPTITNCTFSGNTAVDWGGAIFNVTSSSPTITGCIFTGNTATNAGNIGTGGGICNTNSSSPNISYCNFSGNSADGAGSIYNNASSPTITSCNFSSNTADYGGGMWNYSSSPTITNCTFSGNTASRSGGGMLNSESTPTITGCNFTANTADGGGINDALGGGMYNYKSTLTIAGCTFLDNTATATGAWVSLGGGISNVESSLTITNGTFSGNTAEAGGGMYNAPSSPDITNCTFSGNSATYGGGIYNIGASSPTITNCILWGDTGSEIYNDTNPPVPSPVVIYCDVQGGYGGTGNIDADPLFANAGGGDFHLLPGSPCIDTGSNAAVPGGVTEDFEGDARIIDGDGDGSAAVDMGMDETDYPTITSFAPTSAATGTSVTVTGIRFTGATAVKFGGTDAASFTVDLATQITAVVGSGSSGKVSVTTPGGTCSSIDDFTFDNAPPTDPTNVQSTSHTVSTWSGDNTIAVTWTDATDAGSGLDGYSILWDTGAATIPDTVKDIEEGVQATTSAALADGSSHYFHIRSVDNVGNWQSTVHLGPFFIDTAQPADPTNVHSPSHAVNTRSDDNTIAVTWTDATDATSGLDGYSILWDTSAATVPDTVKDIEEGVQAATSPALADGNSHYFHIRSVDSAGNWQSAIHLGPFFIDTTPSDITPPTAPGNVQSTSHIAGWWSDDNTIDVTWTDATDAGSGLDGYSVLWDTNAATVPDAVKDIEEGVQAATSPVLFDDYSHYFHIRSVDNAGNWQSAVHLGPFFIDTTPTEPAEERTSPTRPAPVPATAGDAFVSNNVSTTGVFTQTVTAPSADGKVRVIVEKGVRGLSAEGKRLSWVTVRPAFYTPSPPAGAHIIGLCYRFQPSGATFSPPITITYTYDESEIPPGIAEEDLVIALYDEATGQWVELESTVDPVTNTITTRVSHFSVHAILAHGIPPVQESAVPIQESTTPTPESSNRGLIGGITGACIVVIVILLVVLGRRRSHRTV